MDMQPTRWVAGAFRIRLFVPLRVCFYVYQGYAFKTPFLPN